MQILLLAGKVFNEKLVRYEIENTLFKFDDSVSVKIKNPRSDTPILEFSVLEIRSDTMVAKINKQNFKPTADVVFGTVDIGHTNRLLETYFTVSGFPNTSFSHVSMNFRFWYVPKSNSVRNGGEHTPGNVSLSGSLVNQNLDGEIILRLKTELDVVEKSDRLMVGGVPILFNQTPNIVNKKENEYFIVLPSMFQLDFNVFGLENSPAVRKTNKQNSDEEGSDRSDSDYSGAEEAALKSGFDLPSAISSLLMGLVLI